MTPRDAAPASPSAAALQGLRELLGLEREALHQCCAAQRALAGATRDAATRARLAAASTRVEARLHLDHARAREAEPAERRGGPAGAGRWPWVSPAVRVFVVDDLGAMRRLLVRQLTRAGHEVVGEAGTAAEAVAGVRRLAPDVVVLDVHLPDGLGPEVAARFAAPAGGGDGISGGARRPPAVVFCTGDVPGALALGAGAPGPEGERAVVEKPGTAAELDAAVRAAAARARLAAGRARATVRTSVGDR